MISKILKIIITIHLLSLSFLIFTSIFFMDTSSARSTNQVIGVVNAQNTSDAKKQIDDNSLSGNFKANTKQSQFDTLQNRDDTVASLPQKSPVNSSKPSTVVPTPSTPPIPTTPTKPTPDNRCLIQIYGVVYNVTEFRHIHSGGDIFQCGTDMTAVFRQQHSDSYLQQIQKYRI